jgi:polyisoprenoid-binding protein YceI
MSPPGTFSFARVTTLLMFGVALASAGCEDKKAPSQAAVAPAASASGAPLPAGDAVRYVIEPNTSKVAWTGAKITASHEGSFSRFKGTITVPGGKPENAQIHLEIATPSLMTTPDKLMGHLKSQDFFDVEKFPTATFDSTAVAVGGAGGATETVTGNLSLHGVTKSVAFPAVVTVLPEKVSAKADFTLSRKDWNLVYPGLPDDLIKDDVAIHLIIEAPKQGS